MGRTALGDNWLRLPANLSALLCGDPCGAGVVSAQERLHGDVEPWTNELTPRQLLLGRQDRIQLIFELRPQLRPLLGRERLRRRVAAQLSELPPPIGGEPAYLPPLVRRQVQLLLDLGIVERLQPHELPVELVESLADLRINQSTFDAGVEIGVEAILKVLQILLALRSGCVRAGRSIVRVEAILELLQLLLTLCLGRGAALDTLAGDTLTGYPLAGYVLACSGLAGRGLILLPHCIQKEIVKLMDLLICKIQLFAHGRIGEPCRWDV